MQTGETGDLKPSHDKEKLQESEEWEWQIALVLFHVLSSEQTSQEERVNGYRHDLPQTKHNHIAMSLLTDLNELRRKSFFAPGALINLDAPPLPFSPPILTPPFRSRALEKSFRGVTPVYIPKATLNTAYNIASS